MKDQKVKNSVAQNPVKSTLMAKKSDSLVIDFESMLVPGSILLAGLMISLSIIFSFKGFDFSTYSLNSGNTKTTTTGTTTDTTGTTNTDTTNPQNDGTVAQVSLDDDPYLGDKSKAKIAIVEFSDYECPFCKRHFQEVYPTLYDKYIKTGKAIYVYRDLPLSFHEPAATLDDLAANCVFDQAGNTKYFKMHDLLFNTTQSNGDPKMNRTTLLGLAKKVGGLNMTEFTKCFDDKKYATEIQKDSADAAAAGVSGTPGFIIGKIDSDGKTVKNGTFLGGAYPIENFQTILDGLLK